MKVTPEGMKKRPSSPFLALLIASLTFHSSFGASTLSEPTVTILPAGATFNISAIGTGDWIMPGVTDKAGGTTLAINGSANGDPTPGLHDSVGFLVGAPLFDFVDGTSPNSSTGELSHFEHFTSGVFTITATVQPVTQVISLFFGATNAGTATSTRVRAFLSGGDPADDIAVGYTSFNSKFMRWDYSFSSTTSKTIHIEVSKYADYGTSTGIFAAATTVPEPSTLGMLSLGLAASMLFMRRIWGQSQGGRAGLIPERSKFHTDIPSE